MNGVIRSFGKKKMTKDTQCRLYNISSKAAVKHESGNSNLKKKKKIDKD